MSLTRKITVVLICLGFSLPVLFAQKSRVTLQDCYSLAEANSKIAGNPQLLDEILVLQNQNVEAGRLPEIRWNARTTWQNEVFGLPFQFPGADFSIPLYSLQTNFETTYQMYDGGLAQARSALNKAKTAAEKQAVAVSLNKLKEQVDRFFFAALLLQEQERLMEITEDDLEAKAGQLEAGVRHGVVLESDLKKVQVEQLRLSAGIEQTKSDRKAMLSVLGNLTGQKLDENTRLELPVFDSAGWGRPVDRPESVLFDLKKQQALTSGKLLDAAQKPKVNAFITTGLGYPDPLNFFDKKISPYLLGGVQFTWKFWDWKQTDREREQLGLQAQIIENEKKAFEQSIVNLNGKYEQEILNLENQMAADEAIAKLQAEILSQLSSQLEHGVITATDYLLQSNAELQTRLTKEVHRVQRAQLEAAWRTLQGWE